MLLSGTSLCPSNVGPQAKNVKHHFIHPTEDTEGIMETSTIN